MTRAKVLSGLLLRDAELGDRALLMYPPGLAFIEAFLGCLYAGIVAGSSISAKTQSEC